jgi:uncharacterized membrane protein
MTVLNSYLSFDTNVFAGFSEFPNLHPLVVHFPIVLLLVAFLTQLASFFFMRREMSLFTTILYFLGFAGAFLAAKVFHAHADNLSDAQYEIFETHEKLAYITMWGSLGVLVLKIISHFILKRKLYAELLVLLLMAVTAVTVSMAGHLGSQMVYIEKIGPGGEKVQQERSEGSTDSEEDEGGEENIPGMNTAKK